jgi:hypothetical protein
MPNPSQTGDQWWINDQTPDNPYGKSEDYDSFLDYLGALNRSLTPATAATTLRINVSELNDHPECTRSPPPALIERHDEFAWRYEGGITRPVLILWRYDAQGAC